MKLKTIKERLSSNILIKGSALLFIASMFTNIGNYFFHLLMGRMLGPKDYGVLVSLISLGYYLGVPNGTLSLVVMKFTSLFKEKKGLEEVRFFYRKIKKKIFIALLVLFALITVFSARIAGFLHINQIYLVLIAISSSLINLYVSADSSVLRALLRFGDIFKIGLIRIIIKVGLAVALVLFGLGVLGPLLAILLSSITGILIFSYFINQSLPKQGKLVKDWTDQKHNIIKYSIPSFISTLAFTSLYTVDIVLARHFLPAQQAGFYSALATLGKIVFFASNPIAQVMFPTVSNKFENGKNYKRLFLTSLGLLGIVCIGIGLIYYFLPELMINLLYGEEYLSVASELKYFSLFLSFYSISYMIVNFYLSLKKSRVVIFPFFAALIQPLLIYFYHHSLAQIVLNSVYTTGILSLFLIVYYLVENGKQTKTPISSNSSI
jgi:O-antigen/teichoic acid export membrane protein